jgi:hypothetical protein
MASALPRLALLLAGALIAAAVGGGEASQATPDAANGPTQARALDGHFASTLRADRLARLALSFRGGPIVTSTGETVHVLVSDSLPAETPEKWAEFIAKMTHGPELQRLESATLATLAEVSQICGPQALGCYGDNSMVVAGELVDDATPEETVRHEYGHHIANHRLNNPWLAIDWGPKHWASAVSVCPRVSRKEAFPGGRGRTYAYNPGEAWAEVYRLMDERKAGIATASWPIIARAFFPNEAALQAAERDVVQPWAKSTAKSFTRTFGKKTRKVWWIRVSTPLDGELKLSARVPREGLHEVALVGPNRKTVVKRAQWVGQRLQRATPTNVCGQRTFFVRVTRKGSLGKVTVTVTTP